MNRLAIAFVLSFILAPGLLNAQDSKRSDVLKEYCKRAAQLPPRDANAHFSFYLWCTENGFSNEAGFYLKEALVIDEDHGDAREALGYARYGSSWVLKADLAKRTGSSAKPSKAEKTPELVITKAPATPDPADLDSCMGIQFGVFKLNHFIPQSLGRKDNTALINNRCLTIAI